jgi:hypothetical protein
MTPNRLKAVIFITAGHIPVKSGTRRYHQLYNATKKSLNYIICFII